MPDHRVQGPIGRKSGALQADGTLVRRVTHSPGPVGSDGKPSVASMALEDRFISVLHRTLPKLPGDLQEEFAALLSPAAIAILVGVLVVWAGSHHVGVGFVVDVIMIVGGVIFLGWQVWSAAADFVAFLNITYSARTTAELDQAATHLSNFIAVVGVAAFVAMLTRVAGKRINLKAAKARVVSKVAKAVDVGMSNRHFQAIRKVAMSSQNPRVILFRKTNPASAKYIERGYPPKPKEIKVKTDSKSGIATCEGAADVKDVRGTVDPVSKRKFYTVDRNRRTATNGDGDIIDLSGEWPKQPGQVIDPTSKKPLVGDYDLFDVFDPKLLAGKHGNQGNLVVVSDRGKIVDDFTSPEIKRAIADMNSALGSRRVMHGHHGAFDSIDNLKADEVVTAFLPDGSTIAMNLTALKQFYENIGRSTLDLIRYVK